MLIERHDDSFECNKATVIIDDENHDSGKIPHTSSRPPCPVPPLDIDEEAFYYSRREGEDEELIQPSTRDPASGYDLQTIDVEKTDEFPASLSLEEYHQRGKPRKTTPKSAVKDSMTFEQQRFSRMKSAPQRSPVPSRSPDHKEAGWVLNPNMTSDTNNRPLSRIDSPSLPPIYPRKEPKAMPPMLFPPKHLEQEEDRIKMNIWNHPISPLPNIPSRFVPPKEEQQGTKSSMLTTALAMASNMPNTADTTSDHHAATQRNTLLRDLLTPGCEVDSKRKTTHLKIDVNVRSGGLTYFMPLSCDQRKRKRSLPRHMQSRRERTQEREQRIATKLIQKNNTTKKNLENLELARKKRRNSFEARLKAFRHRYQELLERRHRIQTSLEHKQKNAKNNREILQTKRQGRFQRAQERRKLLQVRKKVLSQIRKAISMEENAMDIVTEHGSSIAYLPDDDGENPEAEQQNDEGEGIGEGIIEGNIDGVERDGERGRLNEPQSTDRRNAIADNGRRMGEIDNGNVIYVFENDSGRGDDGSQDTVQRDPMRETGNFAETFGIAINPRGIPRSARGEDYQSLRSLFQLEATYTLQGHRDIGLFPRPFSEPEQQDYPIEGWSHYMLAIRAIRDNIEEISADYSDGTSSTAALPIVFQESKTAQGDYFDEREDTPSITDDEYLEEIEEMVGFVDDVLPQRESAPDEQINVRMRPTQGPSRH
ncbi:uncharacterized protein LOC121423235 [Lytechinus variegatus]|uniref:uncharacterized protein LOC121423235 n=1 Tax=Lytechinus variegatus TaxID=7654 RepID=UPI001BB10695|nr:uncharacterized protein LOC121423235 [Lytechinus variegatus]